MVQKTGSLNRPMDKRPLIIEEAKRNKFDFMFLSETRLLGSDNFELDGYTLIWSGHSTQHVHGVAILMKNEHAKKNSFH